jgi:hypothetical protein
VDVYEQAAMEELLQEITEQGSEPEERADSMIQTASG